jgi:nitroimidazol reductase NimA-like FMN-containing flavoprotein (pyridoxamine 5'-phosphate oxidase superfamily)
MINQISNEEAWALLGNGRVGHLGCIANDYPYVIPIHYLVEGNYIYAHSLWGYKVAALRANPRACLQVDQVRDECHWRSVIAYGDYEEVQDTKESARILANLFSRFPTLTPVESSIASDANPPEIVVMSIRVNKITAVGEGVWSSLI